MKDLKKKKDNWFFKKSFHLPSLATILLLVSAPPPIVITPFITRDDVTNVTSSNFKNGFIKDITSKFLSSSIASTNIMDTRFHFYKSFLVYSFLQTVLLDVQLLRMAGIHHHHPPTNTSSDKHYHLP